MNKKKIILISGAVAATAVLIFVMVMLLGRGIMPGSGGSSTTRGNSSENTTIDADSIVQSGDPDDVFTTADTTEDSEATNGDVGSSAVPGTNTGNNTTTGDNTTTGNSTPTDNNTTTTAPETDDAGLKSPEQMNYEQYMAMSESQQQAFFVKYFADDPLQFATWFQKVKKEYDDANPPIIVTGPVDLSTLPNQGN